MKQLPYARIYPARASQDHFLTFEEKLSAHKRMKWKQHHIKCERCEKQVTVHVGILDNVVIEFFYYCPNCKFTRDWREGEFQYDDSQYGWRRR